MIYRWKATENSQLLYIVTCFTFLYFYYEFSKNRNHHKLNEKCFERNSLTTYRNIANDIPLKSYWNLQTFSCFKFFQILHSFGTVLKILKICFIKRWSWIIFGYRNDANDMALERYWNSHLFRVLMFFKFYIIFEQFWKYRDSFKIDEQ